MFIKRGKAKIILNSRKEKTIEICIETYEGKFCASAPSGKSKGKNEVPDYNSRGIAWSVRLANTFLSSLEKHVLEIRSWTDLKILEI